MLKDILAFSLSTYLSSRNGADNLIKLHTSSSSNEREFDDIDASCWLDENVGSESVRVDHVWRVDSLVSHDSKIDNAASSLNVTKERFDRVFELVLSELVIKVKEERLRCRSDRLFHCDKEAANVNTIESACSAKTGLITK
jgi:hypothetical protein